MPIPPLDGEHPQFAGVVSYKRSSRFRRLPAGRLTATIFANAIATFNNEDGVAIGTTLDGGICFVDRAHGRGNCYFSGLGVGGFLLRSNLPSSMLIGAKPVELGKQTKRWWEGFHFIKDEVWVP
jgi:hypothetical protein